MTRRLRSPDASMPELTIDEVDAIHTVLGAIAKIRSQFPYGETNDLAHTDVELVQFQREFTPDVTKWESLTDSQKALLTTLAMKYQLPRYDLHTVEQESLDEVLSGVDDVQELNVN